MKITKLVRDRIPELMQQQGKFGEAKQVDGSELDLSLRTKLIEEAHEVKGAPDTESLIEELADVVEVVSALAKLHSIDQDTIEARRVQKKEKRGGFEKGYVYTYETESNEIKNP